MKFKLSFVLIAVLIANLLQSGAASAQTTPVTEIYVLPVSAEATTCNAMTFEVWVKNVVDLTAFHLEIGFTPGNVEVINVVNGNALIKPGETTLFEPTNGWNNDTGKILWGMAQQGTNGDPQPKDVGPEGAKLITITLQAKKPGYLVPFTIDGAKSVLVNWPDVFQIPFIVTGPGAVSTSSCAPTNIALSSNTIENGRPAGTIVGTLTTTDPDSSHSWESWSYSMPYSDGDNALFAIFGDKVSTLFTADFVTKNSYAILIRSTDAGGRYLEKSITITVNSAPVINPIPEQNATVGELLTFTVIANDADLPADAVLVFSLQDAPDGAVINPATGVFTWTPGATQGPADYVVTVCASDGDTTTCQDLTIKVAAAVVPQTEYKLYLPIISR